MHRISPIALSLVLLSASVTSAAEPVRDVVVYGGTSAGVIAAIQVSRMGRSVVLIAPERHLGGLTTAGLGWTDSGNKGAIGGLAREFYRRVKQYYERPEAWKHERPEQYDRFRAQEDAMWTFEPHVAEALLEQMLAEARVEVRREQRLDRVSPLPRQGKAIIGLRLEGGEVIPGRMFIDATYEGDLLAAAGVDFMVGREPNAKFGETLNGVQAAQNVHNHRFVKPVDPYVRPGDPSSGLLPGIQADAPGKDGEGDRRVQAYCYRMCLSRVPQNRVPFPKPADYNELRYELMLRNFEAGDLRLPMKNDMMPNGKTDTNNNCAFSTDNLGMNYDYPEATYEQRARILREHTSYQQGLMWTLANHPRVPASIRQEMSQWGLAADEFTDTGNWPHQIYVREARRLAGQYVTTELDCRRVRVAKDSVGLGSYNMDSHNVQRYVDADGHAQNEGDVQVSPGGAYVISYGSLVPRRGQCPNLLVPVCLSASHIAYGSIRMEPVFMILGQSSATAAVLALQAGQPVQEVDYAALRARLLEDKQVLDLPPDSRPRRLLLSTSLPGVVQDDDAAILEGVWTTSQSSASYIDKCYRHDGNEGKGEKTATFRVKLKPGRYEVRLSYTPNSNRASNTPVEVRHAGGRAQGVVNQRKTPPIDETFISLGTFAFGEQGEVVVSTRGTDGYVVVDGVQFLPK